MQGTVQWKRAFTDMHIHKMKQAWCCQRVCWQMFRWYIAFTKLRFHVWLPPDVFILYQTNMLRFLITLKFALVESNRYAFNAPIMNYKCQVTSSLWCSSMVSIYEGTAYWTNIKYPNLCTRFMLCFVSTHPFVPFTFPSICRGNGCVIIINTDLYTM